ncbi:carbohydrate ABC transporter permease [Alicyclobacillus dauci]|uniref:Sugar ABC transporter permease n=1 Tax=Alicyclobacillus dauci TaxID=1475485 RepID=A0ABY6YZK7_9BACL|nr:sugar ABC transporter permease [Alicyclobacillus dauci]WAH36057.1 sugar ABC transporter permease [Alicyclobacillus dauci]
MAKLSKRQKGDMWFAILLLVPTILVLVRIFIWPIYQSLVWSFYHYNLLDGSAARFIGLKNYVYTLTDPQFWMSTWRAIYFTVFTCSIELVLGLFSALLLNQVFRGRTIFRAMIIIPWASLTLVNGLLWNWILQPQNGALQVVMHALHLLPQHANPNWLASTDGSVIWAGVADIWKMTPFMTLLLLAGLQSISGELYEASMMDGAGFWRKVWSITIPQLTPAIIVALVLRIMGTFRVYDILTVFTGDPSSSVTYLTMNYGFRYFYMGKASAMAWTSTLFILALIIVYIRMMKKNMDEQT